MTDTPQINRLAVYGSLVPGRSNHHQLAELKGEWRTGTVRGRVIQQTWGDEPDYPALIPDPHGEKIDVHVFESSDLPEHWSRLDEFEGPGYRRVLMEVHTDSETVPAWIYVTALEL